MECRLEQQSVRQSKHHHQVEAVWSRATWHPLVNKEEEVEYKQPQPPVVEEEVVDWFQSTWVPLEQQPAEEEEVVVPRVCTWAASDFLVISVTN